MWHSRQEEGSYMRYEEQLRRGTQARARGRTYSWDCMLALRLLMWLGYGSRMRQSERLWLGQRRRY